MNNEPVTVAIVDVKETTEQRGGINTTETININPSTNAVENTTELAPDDKSAMEWCNETFSTPKGTIKKAFRFSTKKKHQQINKRKKSIAI